jgi:hypothetical protein
LRESPQFHARNQHGPPFGGPFAFLETHMHKMNEEHAAKARKAIAACKFDPHQDTATSVKDLLVDLGHLSDAEQIDFVETVKKALNAWAVERIDPMSVADGPVVEIHIGTEGLPPKPEPNKRPDKRKKSRPA